MPPAMQGPFTAATIGFVISKPRSAVRAWTVSSVRKRRSHSVSGARAPDSSGSDSARSPPEQKALSPAPVRMTTRISSSSAISPMASARRQATSGLMALRRSGRLKISVATWPSRS